MNRNSTLVCALVISLSATTWAEARGRRIDYAALALADQAAIERQGDSAAPGAHAAYVSATMPSEPPRPARRSRQSEAAELEALHRAALDDLPVTSAGGRMSTQLISPVPQPVLISGRAHDPEARFDLSVNNAPAHQVFLQLGVGTAYSMLVSPELSGTVTVGLKNTTVPEALEVLRELFGYDYRIDGTRVFIYPNTVQTRIFRINYLPGRRQGTSDLRVSSSSITGTGGGSGSSGSGSGSSSGAEATKRADDTSHVRMSSDTDFWQEVQQSLVSMVGTHQGRSVVMNPAAGVIVVRATPAEHRHVADYLRAVKVSIERQVMLEAKIVDVQLSRESQTGVNWSLFRGNSTGNRVGLGNVAPGVTLGNGTLQNTGVQVDPNTSIAADISGRGFYGLAVQATNFTALINFLQTQGDVQVLSSPRIATVNNQKAILKVGSDELFVTGVTTNTTTSGTSTVTTPTLTLQPFFSGIALDVTPQIDDTGTVMLHVHPSVSVVKENNKTIDLGELGQYKLPLAASAINETDSIVRVKDGHIVAIGGLMRQYASADKNGVPGLAEAPVVGGLFSQKTNTSIKRELVVLIRPTVISDDGVGWAANEPATSLISPVR